MFSIKNLMAIICVVMFSSCAIGPKYVKPKVETPKVYKESKDWKVALPQDGAIRGAWWEIFKDPQLNALENQVNISNQNIVAAQAQYAASYALVQAAKSSFFPILTTNASYARTHTGTTSANAKTASQNLLSEDVSW